MIDEQINIALDTRDNLVNQREILKVNYYNQLLAITDIITILRLSRQN